MYSKIDDVILKTGEIVEAGIVSFPNEEWTPKIAPFLAHKGEPWNSQIMTYLTQNVDLEVYSYVLQKEVIISHIMVILKNGVGYFGHVFTREEDRQKNASTILMRIQMQHFRKLGGKALFLGTDNPIAFRSYKLIGFNEIIPDGTMAFYSTNPIEFEREYFQITPCKIESLAWHHYPSSVALFVRDQLEMVRCIPANVIGRSLPEDWMLELIIGNLRNIKCAVLKTEKGAVVGFTACGPHPSHKEYDVVDVFCHDNFWKDAVALVKFNLDGIAPVTKKLLAFVDKTGSQSKEKTLRGLGFVQSQSEESKLLSTTPDALVFELSK